MADMATPTAAMLAAGYSSELKMEAVAKMRLFKVAD